MALANHQRTQTQIHEDQINQTTDKRSVVNGA
jgi:hypothetical protein